MRDEVLEAVAGGVLTTINNMEAAEAFAPKRPPERLSGILVHNGQAGEHGAWKFYDGEAASRAVYLVDHDAVELDAGETYLAEVQVVRGHPRLSDRSNPCRVKVLKARVE